MILNDYQELKTLGYNYISPCGLELNAIQSDDAPFVFHTMQDDLLFYAGTKSIRFDPSQICVSKSTGKIYHYLHSKAPYKEQQIGLFKSSVLLEYLYDGLDMEGSTFHYNGISYPLKWIDV
jgi:hypothetical protein